MDQPGYTVEPVTQLAWLQLGYRVPIMAPRKECWGFHRTVEQARLAADRLNAPPPMVKVIKTSPACR